MTGRFTFLVSTYNQKMRNYRGYSREATLAAHLFVEVLGEFHCSQEFELLVGESTILVGRRALEKS